MPFPAVLIKVVKATGAVFATVEAIREAIAALDPDNDGSDVFRPIGNQTVVFEEKNPRHHVGIINGLWSIANGQIPESPRGQLEAHVTLTLNRAESRKNLLGVTIVFIPQWYDVQRQSIVNLPFGSVELKVPVGSSSFEAFVHIDAAQAFSSAGEQFFRLICDIQSPAHRDEWDGGDDKLEFVTRGAAAPGDRGAMKGVFSYF